MFNQSRLSQDIEEGLEQTRQPASIYDQPGPLYLDDAVRTRGDMNPAEFIGFSRGRHSLDRSVWYNGLLMTFLATGEETQGQFALIEEVASQIKALSKIYRMPLQCWFRRHLQDRVPCKWLW